MNPTFRVKARQLPLVLVLVLALSPPAALMAGVTTIPGLRAAASAPQAPQIAATTGPAVAEAPEAANLIAKILGSARRFAVFHGIEPGNPAQYFSFDNSVVWGNMGIGPGSYTTFSRGSNLVGDCYQQPGQGNHKGCAGLKTNNLWPAGRDPLIYKNYTTDLSGVVTDIRNAANYVRGLTPTQTINGNLTAGTPISSSSCGTVNVIRVTGTANVAININGCPTDYFIFDVAGDYRHTGRTTLTGGVTGANILWVFGGEINNSGGDGWLGTLIVDAVCANNVADDLNAYDSALLVLNGRLSLGFGGRFRQNGYTVYDYGDAPDSYGTLFSSLNGAARHKYVSDFVVTNPTTGEGTISTCTSGGSEVACLRLGTNWDSETDGQPNTAALGDNTSSTPNDEDGINEALLVFIKGQTATVAVSVNNEYSDRPAYLKCWLDLDGSGMFDSGEAQTVTVPPSTSNGTVNLNFGTVPTSAPASTYLRCRISSDQAAITNAVTPIPPAAPSPAANDPIFPLDKTSYELNDQWPDGEVEDYQVAITNLDDGDAPDTGAGTGVGNYNTLATDNGPSHVIVSGLQLGVNAPDADAGTLQDAAATADDTNNTDDEDGVTTLPGITTASTSVPLSVAVLNATGSAATLACWLDFNRDGDFLDTGERASATVASQAGQQAINLTFTGFAPPTAGVSYLRCRLANGAGEVMNPTGVANTGEVEDYQVVISGVDYGDAPDTGAGTGVGNYNTLATDSGPSHAIVSGLQLGVNAPDADAGTLQNAAADADDTTGTPDDEDGVTTLPSVSTTSTSVPLSVAMLNNTGSPATLACWLDFNRDGDFLDAGERASATVASQAGQQAINLTFNGFAAPVAGTRYLRCRLATAAGEVANPTGAANSGEVEDYQVAITGLDYGDAPDTGAGTGVGNYNTLATDNGPSHVIVSGLQMGLNAPDADAGTLQDTAATADDTNNIDDEDGVTTLPVVTMASTSAPLRASVLNNTGSAATLACWLDFNRDGDFLDAGERASATVASQAGQQAINLTFTGFAAPTAGTSYLRCRLANAAGEVANPSGAANSGEVEDYQVAITGLDYGDLPDPPYPTLRTNNGARHKIVTGVYLGAGVDPDPGTLQNATATADDGSNTGRADDEDGVQFLTPLMPGTTAKIRVTISDPDGMAYLSVFIDFDENGVLDPVRYMAIDGVPAAGIVGDLALASGTHTLTIHIPANTTGKTPARFRLTDDCGEGGNSTTGLATTGEVEDYVLASLGDYVWDDTDKDGQQDGGETPHSGVMMRLLDGSGNPVLDGNNNQITDVTDVNGKYQFSGLPPGSYSVGFVPPAHNSFTQPDQGNDASDSDADVATVKTQAVALGPGETNSSLDAGVVPVNALSDVAIGNLVFCDVNGNGIAEPGDNGVSGVTVRLYSLGPDNTPYTVDDVPLLTLTTDVNGRYVFLALPAGPYTGRQYYVGVVKSTVPLTCGSRSSAGGGGNPDRGDQNLPGGDDGVPGAGPASSLAVSGVITVWVMGQTTPDSGNPLGYANASAYMTVDFGFTSAPNAVTLSGLQAAPLAPWEALLTRLRQAMR